METKTTIIDAMNAHADAKAGKWLTDVIFLWDQPGGSIAEVFAFFPKEVHSNSNIFSSYSHVGQHSGCHIDYAKECRKATKKEYQGLKTELEGIGYNLNILKSI